MHRIAFWRRVAACAFVIASAGTAVAQVAGTKPGYLLLGPSSVPNEQAITRMVWAPGLDDGYVPQGITVADDAVIVSGYRSVDPKVGSGPCRVFRIVAGTGAYDGFFDLPAECGHAGGLAYLGKDVLLVADTRRVYLIEMKRAFAEGGVQNALKSSVTLGGKVKGSFAAFDGTDIWLGANDKDESGSRIFRFPTSLLDQLNGKGRLNESRALATVPIPVDAQGAAFDRDGALWVTTSSSRFGMLYRLDPRTGEKQASYEMVIGIEDIGFDAQGRLWSVSEAGSQRWAKWSKVFPIVFQVDIGKLK